MSVSYYSYAVLGCEVPVAKLYRTVVKRHEEHAVPLGAKYCPTCGKLAVIEYSISIFDEETEQIGQFPIIWSTGRKRAFIGLTASGSDYRESKCIKVKSLSELKEQLQNSLRPLDLWNENKFGLYAVQYCSI